MPRYRKCPAVPAKGGGDGVDVSLGGSGAGPAVPGFGPNSKAANDPSLGGGPGGFRSSQSNPTPPVWKRGDMAEDFNLPEEV